MDEQGNVVYEGLRKGFSGYMNRAALVQEAEMLDVRCMRVNPACEALICKSLEQTDINKKNQEVCKILKDAGYKLIWDPEWMIKE